MGALGKYLPQPPEALQVLVYLLDMPLYADDEARRIAMLEHLDAAVFCGGRYA